MAKGGGDNNNAPSDKLVSLDEGASDAASCIGKSGLLANLSSMEIENTGLSTQDALMLLSMYLSAIIHDYDHRGLTNPFLIQDEDPLAVSMGLDPR